MDAGVAELSDKSFLRLTYPRPEGRGFQHRSLLSSPLTLTSSHSGSRAFILPGAVFSDMTVSESRSDSVKQGPLANDSGPGGICIQMGSSPILNSA